MNDLQQFIERLEAIIPAEQMHLITSPIKIPFPTTEMQLSDFPDWPASGDIAGFLNSRMVTIYLQKGKPSSIVVAVEVDVDSSYLGLDPTDREKYPGVPIDLVGSDMMQRGVIEDVYRMFATPPEFKLINEEFIISMHEPPPLPVNRFRLRLVGRRDVKDEDELFRILKELRRPNVKAEE